MTAPAGKIALFDLSRQNLRQIGAPSRSTNSVEQPIGKGESDALLHGLAAGDQHAFAALYERFGTRLYRAAYRMLARREDAEDVLQEVFVSLVRSQERLSEVRDLTAYLFAALRRAAARCAKQRARQPASGAAAETLAVDRQRSSAGGVEGDRLDRALAALPDEQREVIALKIEGELTFAEIARVLDVSPNTAASRYRYALAKLRDVLGETVK